MPVLALAVVWLSAARWFVAWRVGALQQRKDERIQPFGQDWAIHMALKMSAFLVLLLLFLLPS